MTDREKLVELLQKYEKELCGMIISYEKAAEWLVSRGVTVKEPQKPLTAEEAKDFVLWDRNKPPLLWIEYKTNKEKNRYMYIETVNELYRLLQILSSYGNNVRCWIERPTDEEMEAAEWE